MEKRHVSHRTEGNIISVSCGLSGERDIVVTGSVFRATCELAINVAASDANVLIEGESGTGKELIAALIHANSTRKNAHFVSINCASLSDSLLESQLFGHLRGSFTGAITDRRGLLDEADHGTLFMDGMSDLGQPFQAKLLRVVQEGEFMPVGDTTPRRVDIRFVAATNRPLEQEVSAGRFREDLYYRLNVITIPLPPLRERKEDIEPLAFHFLKRYTRLLGRVPVGISPAAIAWLTNYSWPGNVRELENVMERASIIAGDGPILPEHLPTRTGISTVTETHHPHRLISLAEMEREHIVGVLAETDWHKSRSAEILGISRKTLDRKIADYRLEDGRMTITRHHKTSS